MCGTEQSKEAEELDSDNLWDEFIRDEKFNHKIMAYIHNNGKCLKDSSEKQPFDFKTIIGGAFAKNFGLKKEKDEMENDKATYVPAIFKGFIKNLESKLVNLLQPP